MNSRGGAKRTADLATVRRWARLLDSEFRIPGTKLTFGLDPVIGLIPGVGDLVGPIFGLVVLAHAWRMRVPKIIMARMVINAGLDALLGIIPLIGDTVDLFWKANLSNVTLLERHAYERRAVTTADRVFVAVVIVALLILLLLPIALVIWIGRGLF
jgi:hypothetical protein